MNQIKLLKLIAPVASCFKKPALASTSDDLMKLFLSKATAARRNLLKEQSITAKSIFPSHIPTPYELSYRTFLTSKKSYSLLEKLCTRKGLKPRDIANIAKYDTQTIEFLSALPDEKLFPLRDFWAMPDSLFPYMPKVKGKNLKELVGLSSERLAFIKKYMQFERTNLKTPVFKFDELVKLSELHPDEQFMYKMIHAGFRGESIGEALLVKDLKGKFDFVMSEVVKAKKLLGKNYANTHILHNDYNPKHFTLAFTDKSTGKAFLKTFDENLQLINNEELFINGVRIDGKIITRDMISGLDKTTKEALMTREDIPMLLQRESFKKGVTTTVTSEVHNAKDMFRGKVLEDKVSFIDANGQKVVEKMIPSEVKGVYKIVAQNPDGSISILGNASINPQTGIKIITKKMKSLNGTQTNFSLQISPNGDKTLNYLITDKDGKVLLNRKLTHKFISPNEVISEINGRSYKITFGENTIQVLNSKSNEAITINLDELFANCSASQRAELLKSLKQMSAEDLLYVHDKVKTFEFIEDVTDSSAGFLTGIIETGNNSFVATHELYHLIDKAKNVRNIGYLNSPKFLGADKEIKAVYEKELKLFLEHFPEAQRNHVNYFTNQILPDRSMGETIAETGGLLSGYNNMPFSIRTEYLQRYFPETIAMIESKSRYKKPNMGLFDIKKKFKPEDILLKKFPKLKFAS